jgi:hypothetical protein
MLRGAEQPPAAPVSPGPVAAQDAPIKDSIPMDQHTKLGVAELCQTHRVTRLYAARSPLTWSWSPHMSVEAAQ